MSRIWMDDVIRCPSPTHVNMSSTIPKFSDPFGVLVAHDDFPYEATTILYAIIGVLCLLLAVAIALRHHGVYVMSTEQMGKMFHKFDPSTDNRWWFIFFAAEVAVGSMASIGLQLRQLSMNDEVARVCILFQRMCNGFSCLALCFALNAQRLDKTLDYAGSKHTMSLRVQVRRMNVATVCVYMLYISADFIASHVIVDNSIATDVMYWLFVTAQVVITIPIVFATLWVVIHHAELGPSQLSKVVAAAAVVLHILTMFTPSFWNKHAAVEFVTLHPCPLHSLSFFDILLVLKIVGVVLFYVFVVLEHNRCALLEVTKNLEETAALLNDFGVDSLHIPLSSQSTSAS